jgi:hypothetical protein
MQLRLYPFILLILFFSSQVSAQIKIKTYTSATDTFYWKKYEHVLKPAKAGLTKFVAKNGAATVAAFLAHPPEAFREILNDSLRMYPEKSMQRYLFPIDLNNDQLTDIVFNGSGRNETEMVKIFLNRRDSFDLVFEDFRYISSLDRDKSGFTGITMGDAGVKGDYLYFERAYKFRKEGSELLFIRGKQTVVYKFTERPGRYLSKSIPFKALNDTILVRASARTIDAPYDPKLKTFGNIVAGYIKVISGNVMASEKDADGRVWYFVEIFPDEKPEKSIFRDIDKYPTFITGWVEAEDVSADFADGLKPR